MKRLILIFILTLSFQSWTKADDIRDFQIEGMSIGDSLLEFFNEKIINKDKKIHGNLVNSLEVIISTEEFSKWLASQ